MYKHFVRPLLFLLGPEVVHGVVGMCLRLCPGFILRWFFGVGGGLEREVFGLKFRNPVGLAAGFDKDARLWHSMGALGFGFVEVGTVTPLAQLGNPKPRCFRLPEDGALINRMGFNNHGMEAMVRRLRGRKRDGMVLGVNLGKNSVTPPEGVPGDYLRLFEGLYEYADYFAINVSCPNVKDVTALQNRGSVMAILGPLFAFRERQAVYRPILLKISPDLDDAGIDEMVDIMMSTPLDGMIATNTTTSREGLRSDVVETGGLSGAPLTERALAVVRRVCARTGGAKPVIGVGGVMTPADARSMLDAGASLVQVYTGFIYGGPGFVRRICRFLRSKV